MVAYVMTTKCIKTSEPKVTVWRLRVPVEIVVKVKKLAQINRRSVTKQAQVLLEEAINGNTQSVR
jgi:hypothetical protein